jgi:hypothetical protein
MENVASEQGGDGHKLEEAGPVLIDYRCHLHGIVGQADTSEHDEPVDTCPVCRRATFVTPGDSAESRRHRRRHVAPT